MIQVIFLIVAGVGLSAALGTILAKNLVRAALYLVAFFFTIACQFVLLEAEFLAALQVLVYIGAVAIILMFGIMLTRNISGDDPTQTPSAWRLPGLVAGLGVFCVLAFGITYQKGIGTRSWATTDERRRLADYPAGSAPEQAVNNMAKVVGDELMTRYVIAFETAGLLLTAAVVGAIAVAHREDVEPESTRAAARAARAASPPLPPNATPAGSASRH